MSLSGGAIAVFLAAAAGRAAPPGCPPGDGAFTVVYDSALLTILAQDDVQETVARVLTDSKLSTPNVLTAARCDAMPAGAHRRLISMLTATSSRATCRMFPNAASYERTIASDVVICSEESKKLFLGRLRFYLDALLAVGLMEEAAVATPADDPATVRQWASAGHALFALAGNGLQGLTQQESLFWSDVRARFDAAAGTVDRKLESNVMGFLEAARSP